MSSKAVLFGAFIACLAKAPPDGRRLIAGTLLGAWAAFGGTLALAHEAIPVKREILALYDGSQEGNADATRIHRFAELPLNHLGFFLHFHDVRDGLPDLGDLERYRGVLTWFAGPAPDSSRYLAWAGQAARLNLRYVMLGDVGAEATRPNLQLINMLLSAVGLRHTGDYVTPTLGARIVHKDPKLMEFECRLDPVLPGFPILDVVGSDVKVALSLEAPDHEGRRSANLVTVGGKGGFAAFNYEFCHQRPPLHQGRWLIDPFEFFRSAFGVEPFPIPDTTTVSGRRLYFSLIQSEGWSNPSEIEPYRHSGAIASEVVLHELIESFPDLPVTLDLRDGDLETSAKSARKAHQIAERFFSLAHVQRPARHSLGSLLSRFDLRYPSISNLAALASAAPGNVYYTATANETAYAEQGQVGGLGFHSLKETLENTEQPRRLKGYNLNYHIYSGQYPALLQPVREHLETARAQRLAPVSASQYVGVVEGFFTTVIERTSASSWQIRNRGALQSVRFDMSEGLEIDLEASIGVLGQMRRGATLYAALDEAIEPAIVVLARANPASASGNVIALTDSRWMVRELVRRDGSLSVVAQGYGPGEFNWSGALPGACAIGASRNGQELWRASVLADDNGALAFTAPIEAMEPVRIDIACHNRKAAGVSVGAVK